MTVSKGEGNAKKPCFHYEWKFWKIVSENDGKSNKVVVEEAGKCPSGAREIKSNLAAGEVFRGSK